MKLRAPVTTRGWECSSNLPPLFLLLPLLTHSLLPLFPQETSLPISSKMGVEFSCCSSFPLHASQSHASDPSACESCKILSRMLADSLRQAHTEHLLTAPPTLITKSGCRTPTLVQSPERRSLSGAVTPMSWIAGREGEEGSATFSRITPNRGVTAETSFMSSGTPSQWDALSFCQTPPKWYFTQHTNYSLVSLNPCGKAYAQIFSRISRSLPFTLLRIDRVQNRPLYRTYLDTHQRLSRQAGKSLTVSELFYGTGSVDPFRLCAEKGLDSESIQVLQRPLTCFVEEPRDCWKFGYRTKEGCVQLLLCLVVVGEAVEVEQGEDIAVPPRSESQAVKVRKGKSWVWVIYEKGRSYPAYILTLSQKRT